MLAFSFNTESNTKQRVSGRYSYAYPLFNKKDTVYCKDSFVIDSVLNEKANISTHISSVNSRR
jgi:hypothetical protein